MLRVADRQGGGDGCMLTLFSVECLSYEPRLVLPLLLVSAVTLLPNAPTNSAPCSKRPMLISKCRGEIPVGGDINHDAFAAGGTAFFPTNGSNVFRVTFAAGCVIFCSPWLRRHLLREIRSVMNAGGLVRFAPVLLRLRRRSSRRCARLSVNTHHRDGILVPDF